MKIKSIEFKNHKVLKDLKLDFDTSGHINDISLLIGENGCGKTIILEEIFKIFSGGIIIWNDGVDRLITIMFTPEEKVALSLPSEIISFEYKQGNGDGWNKIKVFDSNHEDATPLLMPKLQNGEINGYLKCMYSAVEINFATQPIDSVKATNIENEDKPKSKSKPDLAHEIAQLLVDIKAQDAAESDKWMREHQNTNADVPVVEGKLDRFKKAYKKMFDGKELCDIRPEGGFQKIMFKNNDGDEFDIDNLSSGEKQVVYRIGYLLRNLNNLSGGIVLIDEPELSLHPRWQIKYIDFLKDVFSGTGIINVQFIIATHSPYLLKNSLVGVGVYIFSKNGNNINIEKPKENSWSLFKNGPTLGEINYYAFKISTAEFHNELYGYIQEKTGNSHEPEIENYFLSKLIDIDRPWIRSNNGVAQSPYNVSLMTYIRNSIHHPENTFNADFTPNDLKSSIEKMIIIMEQDPLFT
jgi:ABC-type cobalamin/Fe3+-siderophores transport system ATPase subunit